MRLITVFYVSASSWASIFAIFDLARDEWDLGPTGAMAMALLGIIPGIGQALGAYGATRAWGWHPALAFSVFVLSVLLVLVTVEWFALRRERTTRPGGMRREGLP